MDLIKQLKFLVMIFVNHAMVLGQSLERNLRRVQDVKAEVKLSQIVVFFRMAQTCPQCRGEGKITSEFCPSCQGQGVVRVMRKIEVKFPAGVATGSQLRIQGEGEVGKSWTR